MAFKYRDDKLTELEQVRISLPRHHLHALITGMRQVGKTALADAYRGSVPGDSTIPGVLVQGAHLTQPAIFFRAVYEGLTDALAGTQLSGTSAGQVIQAAASTQVAAMADVLPLYQQTWDGSADPSAAVEAAWRLPERVGKEKRNSVIVVLDEVQELFHQFARVEPYRGGGGVNRAAWDARGQIQHNTRALWVFTTSLRTVAEQFFGKAGSPFYLQTREVRLDPLDPSAALALASDLADPKLGPTPEALETIANLSGGLPGILIQMIADCRPGDGKQEVEEAVQRSLKSGRLAALYADITASLVREGRQGGRQLFQALHAVARGHHMPMSLARRLAVSPQEAANILRTLTQLGLIEQVDRRTRRLCYPLMREWLLSQSVPPIANRATEEELRTQLGFGFEARVREVLSAIRRPITISDGPEGELLLRPGASIVFGPFRKVHRRKTNPEIDVIAEEERRTLVMGCRYRREHTTGETIREFSEVQLAEAAREFPGVWGAYLSASGFTQGAVKEANSRGVWLITLEGLNTLARAVGEQPFTAP